MGILTLLAGVAVLLIGLFFTIWGLSFWEFQGELNITQNTALPTGIVILVASIMILRKYKSEKKA